MTPDVNPSLPAAPVAALSTDAEAAIGYIRDLQRDGRLLLRHVARRVDRPLGAALLPGHTAAAVDAGGATAPSVLIADPASVVADRVLMEALAATVDELSRRAAPATVSTIRLTSAYLSVAIEGGEPSDAVVARARRLRRMMRFVISIAFVATVLSVLLLAHVDDGRRAVQQLGEVRQDIATLYSELAKLPDAALVTRRGASPGPAEAAAESEFEGFLPFCSSTEEDKPVLVPARGERGARAQALCSQVSEASKRQAVVFLRLAAWNCRTHRIVTLWGVIGAASADGNSCGSIPTGHEDKIVTVRDWHRTEIRTAGSISVLTGFVLPLLLGCVGGCAYALRRLDQKLSEWTLEVRDGSHSLLRVLLATMLGGLLGVVWSGDQPVQLGGFALTLASAAFFVGFALEVVFTVIEAMVDGVAGKLRAPPPPAVVVPAAPVPSRPAPGVGGAG
jgi:hypothetical protein